MKYIKRGNNIMLCYCKKCGNITLCSDIGKQCDHCKNILRPVPDKYLVGKNKEFIKEDLKQQFTDEHIKASPEFEPSQFEHREEKLTKHGAESRTESMLTNEMLKKQEGIYKYSSCKNEDSFKGNTRKKGINKTILASIIGAVATILAAIIGSVAGRGIEKNNIQNEIQEVLGNNVNIIGNDNSVAVNDIDELIKEYLYLKEKNEEIKNNNEFLTTENRKIFDNLNEANKKIEGLQNEVTNKYNVDFQNLNLIINGIESDYNDKAVVIDGETFYSLGFLKFIVDNEEVSSNNKRIFIGDVQSEEQMPVSLFDYKLFTNHWMKKISNLEDNFGNIYEKAYSIRAFNHSFNEALDHVNEYHIDQKYTKFTFDLIYPKDASQNYDYELDIFGDDNFLKTIAIDRKTEIVHVEIDIQGVKFLQIDVRCNGGNWDSNYIGMVNPYLYP